MSRAGEKPLAPDRCVTDADAIAPDYVVLVGEDLTGRVRIRVELSREDVNAWWVRLIRRWLASQHGAEERRQPRLTVM